MHVNLNSSVKQTNSALWGLPSQVVTKAKSKVHKVHKIREERKKERKKKKTS